MNEGDERFLSRWARRKREAGAAPPADATPASPAGRSGAAMLPQQPAAGSSAGPELPSLASLTPESDFTAFMQAGVDGDIRRGALRKLFTDPHFNRMDGLDVYIEDYNVFEPMGESLVANLVQARNVLGWKGDGEQEAVAGTDAPEPGAPAGAPAANDGATPAEAGASPVAAADDGPAGEIP